MRKLVVAIMGAVLVLGACGGDDANNEATPENNNGTENAAGNDTYDAANGEEVYVGNCASCHGGDLEGASGPGLVGHDSDDVLTAIEEGPGAMPHELVSGNDAEDVANWISEQ